MRRKYKKNSLVCQLNSGAPSGRNRRISSRGIDTPIDINQEHPYIKNVMVLQCERLELFLWDMKNVQSFHWEVKRKAFRNIGDYHELPERTVFNRLITA